MEEDTFKERFRTKLKESNCKIKNKHREMTRKSTYTIQAGYDTEEGRIFSFVFRKLTMKVLDEQLSCKLK